MEVPRVHLYDGKVNTKISCAAEMKKERKSLVVAAGKIRTFVHLA